MKEAQLFATFGTDTGVGMKKTFSMIAFGWGVILISLFFYTDLTMPTVNQNSDYLMTFYTAGQLVRDGNTAALYPPADAGTFVDTPFDKAAHVILPLLPVRATAEYMYMPAVAGFFAPFSLMGPSASLLAWQVVSLAALAICAFLFSSRFNQESNANGLKASAFWVALSLLPLAISIWIGQVSVVFGLLPLMVGVFFIQKKKDFLGGCFWALTIIKPQFLVPALMLTVALATTKRFKPAIGIICGVVAFALLNLVAFPSSLFGQWLTTLKLAEVVYSDLKFGVAQHIATSLPRAIILMLPVTQHSIAKPIVYAVSAILGSVGLYFCVKLMRSKLPDTNKLALAAIISIFATPIIVPHVFFYDYSIFIGSGFLAYAYKWPSDLDWRLKSLLWLGWSLVNVYGVIVLVNKKFAIPILFVLLMLEFYRRTLVAAKLALQVEDAESPVAEINA